MSNTATSGITGEPLTLEKLSESLEAMRQYMPKRSAFDDFLAPPRFMGIDIFESPALAPKPKIQVRDIKFSDGTSILSQAFLDEQNAWWAEQFGYQEHIAYMFGRNVFMSPLMAAKLVNFS